MNIDDLSSNTIRVLGADIVRKSNSGHPGAPMGMAAIAHVLWTKIMRYSPSNPDWANRDRFVLSNGHGCALLYTLLHLAGFKVTMDDLKQFRQWGSITPGHPEREMTEGVEVTTGPLGQGICNGVGLALAQRHGAAMFNKKGYSILDNYTYVFCGDGCLQEGVSSEASSLAGHWGLGNLILIWDDNSITIDGETSISFTEDVLKRYESYGWQTLKVANGNDDYKSIEAAIVEAQNVKDRPTIISVKTIIGYLSKEQGTHGVHGSPLKPDDIAQLKKKVGFNPDEKFVVPEEVRKYWKAAGEKGTEVEKKWNATFEAYAKDCPEEAALFKRMFAKELPADWKANIPDFPEGFKKTATRNLSGTILNAICSKLPEVIGGSADLTPSNKTQLKNTVDFQKATPEGRYIRFGVREHGMAAIGNGIAAYGGFIPFTATFLNFITYAYPAVRLSALSELQQLYIMTHDSIGLGEDGPTHQPTEVLALLRATPNLITFRPADGSETAGAYIHAINNRHGPSVFCLSRQGLPNLPGSSAEKVFKGAYVLEDCKEKPDLVFIATGSEVELALNAAKSSSFKNVRVVSAPALELFDEQSVEYRREVLPIGVPIVSIEAQGPTGWERYAHFSIAVQKWGASAPAGRIFEEYGFTPEKVNKATEAFVKEFTSVGSFGPLQVHFGQRKR